MCSIMNEASAYLCASSDLLRVIRRKSACNAGVSNLFIIREILFKNESGRDLPYYMDTCVTTKICPTCIHIHFLSRGIIFHTHDAGDDVSYVRFREAEDKYFNRLLRHLSGTKIRHLVFGPNPIHLNIYSLSNLTIL